MLGLLIASPFLAQYSIKPTVDLVAGKVWMCVGRVLPLSIVTLVDVWSFIQCIAPLYTLYKGRKIRKHARDAAAQQHPVAQDCVQQPKSLGILFFSVILSISILSMGCRWAVLLEDDYKKFLAVSLRECSC